MSAKVRVWLAWGLVAAVLVAVPLAYSNVRPGRAVHFLNPLDEAVTVELAGRAVTIAPGQRIRSFVQPGPTEVIVRRAANGVVLDRHGWEVPAAESGSSVAVYNVLGAAPVYLIRFAYTDRYASTRAPEPTFTPLAGERFRVVNADYAFQEPPQNIDGDRNQAYTWKTQLQVAPGGWKAGVNAVLTQPGAGDGCQLLRRMQRVLPEDGTTLRWLQHCTVLSEGPESALDVAEQAVAHSPRSFDASYALLYSLRLLGRDAEATQRFRALLAAEPGSVAAKSMLLRLLPRDEALALAREAVAAHPKEPEILSPAAYVELQAGHPAEAAALYAEIAGGPSERAWFGQAHVLALVRSGRTSEAVSLALSLARAEDAGLDEALLYVRTSLLAGAKPSVSARDFLTTWTKDAPRRRAWAGVMLGQGLPKDFRPDRSDQSLLIALAAVDDPTKALERVRKAGPGELGELPEEVSTVLALEAYRVGDLASFDRLRVRLPLSPEAVAAYVEDGVEPPTGWRLDPGERTALTLARMRRLQSSGQPVPITLELARWSDPLNGFATLAALKWPRPARQKPPVRFVLQP